MASSRQSASAETAETLSREKLDRYFAERIEAWLAGKNESETEREVEIYDTTAEPDSAGRHPLLAKINERGKSRSESRAGIEAGSAESVTAAREDSTAREATAETALTEKRASASRSEAQERHGSTRGYWIAILILGAIVLTGIGTMIIKRKLNNH